MPVLDLRAFIYVLPVKASVTVIDSAFHAKGDVNWDGNIDATDIDLVRAAFGSKDPNADINGDGVVDIRDVALVVKNQGAKAPNYSTPSLIEVSSGKCVVVGVYRKQILKRTFTAGTRIAFVFTALGLFGRAVIIP